VLSDLSDVGAGRVVRALLDLPASPKNPDQEFRQTFARFEPAHELRAPRRGEGWLDYAVDVLCLAAERVPCSACGGVGFSEARPTRNLVGRLLLNVGADVKGQVPSSRVGLLLERADRGRLRFIADSWFRGDLNLADQFCVNVAGLIRKEADAVG
jgi:hypothetical protein